MNFNEHFRLEGKHAFLSASSYHWLNYDPEKLERVYLDFQAKEKGTELHAFAANAIKLGIRLPKTKKTLNMYVNDAIGFGLSPEVILYYTDNCFGTADAIGFRKNFLRIHDLKTGKTRTSLHQLEIYAALFCLEYRHDPRDIEIELRIYQNDDVVIGRPDPQIILDIMNRIVDFDLRIEKLKMGE